MKLFTLVLLNKHRFSVYVVRSRLFGYGRSHNGMAKYLHLLGFIQIWRMNLVLPDSMLEEAR